jgi:hypothetical protein
MQWKLIVLLALCAACASQKNLLAPMGGDASEGQMMSGGTGGTTGVSGASSASGSPGVSGAPGVSGRANQPPPSAPPIPGDPIRYPSLGVRSPITTEIAERLRGIAAIAGPDAHVMMRAGDANCKTWNENYFWGCLDPSSGYFNAANIAGHTDLQETIDHFVQGRVEGVSPFIHDDVTCDEGVVISQQLSDSTEYPPNRTDYQIEESNPRYAVLMYGMSEQPLDVMLGKDMLWVVDKLIARGTIPLIISSPWLDSEDDAAANGALFDAVQRAIAEGRQVPFASVFQAVFDAPKHGMGDWIHMSTAEAWSCSFSDVSLASGMNQTIYQGVSMLDRARRIVDNDAPIMDTTAVGQLSGEGTKASPFMIDRLPYSRLVRMSDAVDDSFADYTSCGGPSGQTGKGFVYEVDLASAQTVTFFAFNRRGNPVDARVFHFQGSLESGDCKDASDLAGEMFRKRLTLGAGKHYFVVDSPATPGDSEIVFGAVPIVFTRN